MWVLAASEIHANNSLREAVQEAASLIVSEERERAGVYYSVMESR